MIWYPLAVFVAGLLVRLGLIAMHPMLHGGDSLVRLMSLDRVLMSYQLPALQVILFAVARVTRDVVVIDCVMAVVWALVGVGFYYLATDYVEPEDWVAVWSDYSPLDADARLLYERAFATPSAGAILREGPLAVAVARMDCRER